MDHISFVAQITVAVILILYSQLIFTRGLSYTLFFKVIPIGVAIISILNAFKLI